VKVLIGKYLPERVVLGKEKAKVFTVRYIGWKGFKNGASIRTAETLIFKGLETGDQV
jgi:hypothetical protein